MSFRLIADIVAANLLSDWLTSPSEGQIQIANDELKLKEYRPPCVLHNMGQCIASSQENCVCLKMEKEAYLKAYGRLLVTSQLGGQSMTPEQAAAMNKFIDEEARKQLSQVQAS